ncbi:GNAT family N-acetyltransferase [Cohnella candidum]
MMNRHLEEYSLNAWPALRTMVHEGWLLRLAEGYTKRSNSVQAIYGGCEQTVDWDRKIAYCEEQYAQAGLDTVFKITPFVPSGLDAKLADRGYMLLDPTSVRVLDRLDSIKIPTMSKATIEETLTEGWLETMAGFNGTSDHGKAVTRKMLTGSPLTQGFCTLYADSVPVACGLGVIEQGHVGLLDIVTDPNCRNRGYGEQLILHILRWARENGAARSYLQVVQNNAPAVRLYEKLGYEEIYTYWYRQKKLG